MLHIYLKANPVLSHWPSCVLGTNSPKVSIMITYLPALSKSMWMKFIFEDRICREEHVELLKRLCSNYRTDWWIIAGLSMYSPRICLVIPNQWLILECSENCENLHSTCSGMLYLSNIVAKGKATPTSGMLWYTVLLQLLDWFFIKSYHFIYNTDFFFLNNKGYIFLNILNMLIYALVSRLHGKAGYMQ